MSSVPSLFVGGPPPAEAVSRLPHAAAPPGGNRVFNQGVTALHKTLMTIGALAAVLALAPWSAAAQEDQPIDVNFTEDYLSNPENIQQGRKVWKKQCVLCHGGSSGPRHAPKLTPIRYQPEFVYHRVTYGFRDMPSWKGVFDKEERKAVVAYVLSDRWPD